MIPIATTTILAYTQTEDEPGEGITFGLRAGPVRAVISTPTGTETPAPGGGAERVDAVLLCDPIPDLDHTDLIEELDGNLYEVAWVAERVGFGLGHTAAGLVKKAGH